MEQVIQCIILAAACLIVFFIFGALIAYIFDWPKTGYQIILCGFFAYFSIFQMVALPLILWQRPLSLLYHVWRIVFLFIVVLTVVMAAVKRRLPFHPAIGILRSVTLIKAAAAAAVLLLCCFVGIQHYLGWDTAYYIGTVNISLNTDSMYIVDAYTGVPGKYMDLRYALSSFYMHTAVLCKTFRLHPALVQQYTIGTLCVIMSCLTVYLIGRELFEKSKNSAAVLLLTWILLNFFFKTDFTTSQFLLYRAYESKAYCANVIALGAVYITIRLWKDKMRGRSCWLELFIIAFAAIPISMSAILLLPAYLGIVLLAWLLVHRDIKVIPYGFICVLPNICYMLLYFLYAKDYLLINIK